MSDLVLRFAPSPTGFLHLGNARTALLNALLARRAGGTFILRYDDTDVARSTAEFAEGIARDLEWLGIVPDRVEAQSARLDRYEAAAAALKASGRLYPAYETEDELNLKRGLLRARGLPPVYDRAALNLTEADRARLEAEGRQPHWRFKLDAAPAHWVDGVRGPQHVDMTSLSDPVLVRADGTFLYTLTSVVDDLDFGVTDIIRGEDHVTNTGVQIQLFEALGGQAPRFAHHNLLTLPSGEGLSKRFNHLSLKSFREGGYEALAVAAMAVLVGTSEPVVPVESLDALAAKVDLANISRAPARFDTAELFALSARILHQMPYATVAPRLVDLGIGGGEAFWLAVRGNVGRLAEAQDWWRVVSHPACWPADPADVAFLASAADLLPEEPWTPTTYRTWVADLKTASGRSGHGLFAPLRLALTGESKGPELAALLPVMGRDRVVARLRGEEG